MQSGTFLSTSVRTLLGCASFTEVPTDHSTEYLTSNYTFNWENIDLLLKQSPDNQEPLEWALRSKTWFVDTITKLVPVFDTAERLCQKAATTDVSARTRLFELWKWTDSAHDLSKCMTESFGPSPHQTSAVESMLIISAILERAIGNVLRGKNLPVPFLLRDLLLERSLYDTFGDAPIQFTRLLVGMPSALNARNLVWHGFVAPNEMTLRIPASLLILLASLGEILQTNHTQVPSLKPKSKIFGVEELPEISADNLDEFNSTLPVLTAIPSQFLPYWEAAFKRYVEQEFGRSLVLLLPQLELVLRIGFCICNDCPKRLLTAVQSAPHTTLDDMLVETTDGKPNVLCEELGEGLLNALFDLLQRPSGPRIRDRLGHGEFFLKDIPRKLAAVLLSMSVAIATRLSNRPDSQISFWNNYTARFHPTAILLKTGYEVVDHIEKVTEVIESASRWMNIENENLNTVDFLEKALTDGDSMEAARICLNVQTATLFRPRQEIITTLALARTLRALCVALEVTRLEIDKRSSDTAGGRLRSRQRKTLQRMIQITPSVTKGGICLVIMAVRIRKAVSDNPDSSASWQRCVSQMEKYTEKLASYVHGTKNRWEEVKMLTDSFCGSVLPFFTRQDLRCQC